MSIPAGPAFDACSSLIDPSNPAKNSGIQSPFSPCSSLRLRLWHAERWAITLVAVSISAEAEG